MWLLTIKCLQSLNIINRVCRVPKKGDTGRVMQGLAKDKADHISLDFLDSYKREAIN